MNTQNMSWSFYVCVMYLSHSVMSKTHACHAEYGTKCMGKQTACREWNKRIGAACTEYKHSSGKHTTCQANTQHAGEGCVSLVPAEWMTLTACCPRAVRFFSYFPVTRSVVAAT